MSDEDKRSVKRVTQKDRKDRITADDSMFRPKQEPDFPDLSSIDLPDPDQEALASLKNLDGVMRPLVITPQDERFPPIAPKPVSKSARPATLSQKPRRSNRRTNFFTFIIMIVTIGICGYYALLWINPQSALNPLPPPTPFIVITATIDSNPAFVASPIALDAQTDVTPELQAEDLHPFAIAPDGILYVSNQNGRECNWASIAGTVLNADGSPANGQGIRVTTVDNVSSTYFSGTAVGFGEGGYEHNLGSAPIAAEFTIQLVSTAGAPLSAPMTISTQADCSQNVAIVNFVGRSQA